MCFLCNMQNNRTLELDDHVVQNNTEYIKTENNSKLDLRVYICKRVNHSFKDIWRKMKAR